MGRLLVFIIFLLSSAFSQQSKSVTFSETMDIFPNPERGWFKPLYLTETDKDYRWDQRDQNISILWGRIEIDDYRNGPLSQGFLNDLEYFFQRARDYGVKVHPRFAYGYGQHDDAPLQRVLEHMKQIKPVLAKNKDVLNLVDAGFIGHWGEWHNSSNNLTDEGNMRKVIEGLLDMVPRDRMFIVRYPFHKLRHFGGDYKATEPWLDSSGAFSGTPISRIGHLNDCFLSSSSDVGTYGYGMSREFGLNYIGQESAYVPHGGETCAVSNESLCKNAVREMEILHTNMLNRGWKPEVYDRWENDGCYDEITRRLGYRFALESASYTGAVPPGGVMTFSFTVKNVGFGELYNLRPVNVVLQGSGNTMSAPINVDPRWWGAGKTSYAAVKMEVPVDAKEDTYTLALWMPDAAQSLREDHRYAVRFANDNVWDESRGHNIIARDLSISRSAPGNVNQQFKVFKQAGVASIINPETKAGSAVRVNCHNSGGTLVIKNIPPGSKQMEFEIFDLHGRSLETRELNDVSVPGGGLNVSISPIGPRHSSHKDFNRKPEGVQAVYSDSLTAER